MTHTLLTHARAEIDTRGAITIDTARQLSSSGSDLLEHMVQLAHEVQKENSGSNVDLCAIVNARSGKCEQDCAFCSQSSHASSHIDVYGMKSADEILSHAKLAEEAGAHRFCIVTSGGALSEADFETALNAIGRIKSETGLQRCGSLGTLTAQRAEALAAAGLNRYHHNLETARSFYPSICTTQDYDRRVETIRHLRSSGIEACVGGILGLGESPEQRIEFGAELAELRPDSVPINFLTPRPGTKLELQSPLDSKEAIKYLAIYRLMMPSSIIRLAGGRCETLGDDQLQGMRAGVDGLLIGDYLTTFGPQIEKDLAALEELGFSVERSRA